MFNLNDHIFRLLQSEPFFAALSRKVEKRANKAIPTAGVRVNPDTGYFEMVYNPDFFEGLTDNQRSGVLIHEFYHLVFEHVTGRLPDELAGVMKGQPTQEEARKFKLWNIAADLSINFHIGASNLPDNCCIPGGPQFEDLPGNMTAEWYFDALKKKVEESDQGDGVDEGGDGEGQSGGSGQGDPGDASGNGGFDPDKAGQFDSHDDWGGEACDAATEEIAKERLREAMREATNEASSKGWGTVSASTRREIIDKLSSKVDWRKVLRWFVKCSQRANKRSTPRRLNKRYAYIHPGRKIERLANVAISIDQSGSVSDDMLALFYAELNKLAGIATFTVIPFDTRVAEDKVYVWKKGESRKRERVMYGGTCFNAPTDYVNARQFDGHIVLTDLEAPKPKASKCPRIWMTTPSHAARPYFRTKERILAVE